MKWKQFYSIELQKCSSKTSPGFIIQTHKSINCYYIDSIEDGSSFRKESFCFNKQVSVDLEENTHQCWEVIVCKRVQTIVLTKIEPRHDKLIGLMENRTQDFLWIFYHVKRRHLSHWFSLAYYVKNNNTTTGCLFHDNFKHKAIKNKYITKNINDKFLIKSLG